MTARTDEVSMLIRAPRAVIYRTLLDADARLALPNLAAFVDQQFDHRRHGA